MPPRSLIYLDNNATTPLLPEVRAAMLPYLEAQFGNPSSAHSAGFAAREAIETARGQVAELIGAESRDIVFTSCATEAINTAFHSATAGGRRRGRIVTSCVEHSAVLNTCSALEEDGYEVVRLGVDAHGQLNWKDVEDAICPGTLLVSLMWANNETGVIFPIERIAALCRERDALLHVDAVQAAGKIPVSVYSVGIDYLSLSAHKLFGPKGIGALFVRSGAPFRPLLRGGQQESNRRGGTENVAGVVGFGVAATLARIEFESRVSHIKALRDRLQVAVLADVRDTCVYGASTTRVAGTLSVGFSDVDADTLVATLGAEGICVSAGSACLADAIAPSHVIMAMTHSYAKASQVVRFSLSHLNTEAEILRTIDALGRLIPDLRQAAAPDSA